MAAEQLTGVAAVEAYLDTVPEPQRSTLRVVRSHLRKVLPGADEGIKYNMPSFIINGEGVAAYDGFKHHCSYFPFSGSVLAATGPVKGGTIATTGTLQFPVDAPLPITTVRALVKARLAQMSKPANGKRYDYYDDGTVKAVGGVKDGRLNGNWQWFRQDGTLMRAGRFKLGEQVGTWETWDRDGRLTKTTVF